MAIKTSILFVLTAMALMTIIGLTPTKTEALVPYINRPPLWDMMIPSELLADPFKILEQSPLASKDLDTINLARADWKETSGHHVISLDVPGMKREDIKIEVEDNRVLRISGERKPEEEAEGDRWHWAERASGKFWRQFRLPGNADMERVMAHLEDGVLKIKVPKLAQVKKQSQSKVIDIMEQQTTSGGEDIKATKAAA